MIRDQSVLSRPVYDFRLWYSRVSTDKALDEAEAAWMEAEEKSRRLKIMKRNRHRCRVIVGTV